MRAVRLIEIGKPVENADTAVPEIGPSDVLVRIAACGICHSDAHYRAGISKIDPLPVTLGHEVAGRVEVIGDGVTNVSPGNRVYVHYLVSCGRCDFCKRGDEQFCVEAQMIGKHRDGGYAEFVTVPARNVFVLPDEIPFEIGAIMMCSSATALHALKKARLKEGDTVAIFGFGGLGFSALQLAKALGSAEVYAVDINPTKLALSATLGGLPIDATKRDPVLQITEATGGKGVDVAIELVGSGLTMGQSVRCLGVLGRAALVGLTADSMSVLPYTELINKEVEIIGVSDHLASDLSLLMQFIVGGKLFFPSGTVHAVGLDAVQINAALDAVEKSTDHIRSVIVP
jgi:propanol-preferring alcohol dehydrogenase